MTLVPLLLVVPEDTFEKFPLFFFIFETVRVSPSGSVSFIRTSPDHGTGFDIAGKGVAESHSMIEAIKAAIEMTSNSRLLNAH